MAITWNGTSGNDTYDNLTSEDITANAKAGNDFVWTGYGNDVIYGDGGNDTLKGYDGNDTVFGGDDNDQLFGENGDDRLLGEAGNDTLDGGAGDDIFNAGAGDDVLIGATGQDILIAYTGNDQIIGGDGDDTLIGDAGNDILTGGNDADQFKFQSPSDGVDEITDFDYMEGDKVVINSLSFGTISTSDFTSEFDADTGVEQLFFTPASGGSTLIAELTNLSFDHDFIPSFDIEFI